MRFYLVGGELDQVDLMWGQTQWGRTRHGAKLAAAIIRFEILLQYSQGVKTFQDLQEVSPRPEFYLKSQCSISIKSSEEK